MLDLPLYECLLKIRNLNEFKALRDWIEKEESSLNGQLRNLNEDRALHKAQGAAQELEKLKALIDGSQDLLEKHRKP